MNIVCIVWGVLSLIGMLFALIPCLGSLNYINIPFAVIGLVISLIGILVIDEEKRSGAIFGLVCCLIAILLGKLRLFIGFGIL